MKDGEVQDAAGMMNGIDLAVSVVRVCLIRTWAGVEKEIEGDLPKPNVYTSSILEGIAMGVDQVKRRIPVLQ